MTPAEAKAHLDAEFARSCREGNGFPLEADERVNAASMEAEHGAAWLVCVVGTAPGLRHYAPGYYPLPEPSSSSSGVALFSFAASAAAAFRAVSRKNTLPPPPGASSAAVSMSS